MAETDSKKGSWTDAFWLFVKVACLGYTLMLGAWVAFGTLTQLENNLERAGLYNRPVKIIVIDTTIKGETPK